MSKKADSPEGRPSEVMGNKTVMSKGKKPISQYAASMVTSYEKKVNAPPAMRDSDVASAQHFVQDNKK